MTNKELREQRRKNVLGEILPFCLLCGENDLSVLRKAENHHIAGGHEGETMIVCRNCHARLTDHQLDWDNELFNKQRNSTKKAIAFFTGLGDILELLVPMIRKNLDSVLENEKK